MHPQVDRALLQLERRIGQAPERDGQPEVHGTVGEHPGQRLTVGETETGQHGHQDELDDTQPARGDRDGGQDVGQAVGGEQVDRGDHVAEGRDEDPERRRVEEPIGGRPPAGPPQEGSVVDQYCEPRGQALHQGREAVGVEEPDVPRHGADDVAGPLLATGQEVEEPAERAQQDHAHRGGHQDEDGGGRRAVAVEPGRHAESVQDQERHQ